MKAINIDFWNVGEPNETRTQDKVLNFGDALIPLIINAFGYEVKYGLDNVVCTINSDLDDWRITAKFKSYSSLTFWGSGHSYGRMPIKHSIDVRAVRGPLTRDVLGLPKDIPLGDPALLLRELVPIKRRKPRGVLYSPHWTNRNIRRKRFNLIAGEVPWTKYEKFDSAVESGTIMERLERLVNAEFVMANTLHVVVACVSYGIPFAPCKAKHELFDSPWKWADFGMLLGVPFIWCDREEQGRRWWEMFGKQINIPDLTPFVDVFPHDRAFAI